MQIPLMKKYTNLAFLFLSLIVYVVPATAQDLGYRTIDVGGEYQHYSKGDIYTLHLAYNFAVHHSFQLRAGYNKADWKAEGHHTEEEGGGPGFSLGYRYYFPVRPHGPFLGIRADFWRLNINWRQGTTLGKSKVSVVQPGAELGYMFLINDMFFITPAVAATVQSNVNTEGETVGDGFLLMAGISMGWKF